MTDSPLYEYKKFRPTWEQDDVGDPREVTIEEILTKAAREGWELVRVVTEEIPNNPLASYTPPLTRDVALCRRLVKESPQ